MNISSVDQLAEVVDDVCMNILCMPGSVAPQLDMLAFEGVHQPVTETMEGTAGIIESRRLSSLVLQGSQDRHDMSC